MGELELLARGRDADVFALDDRRVLRRYRRGGDVRGEAEVMRHAAAHGVAVPLVYGADGTDLVLERLDGPTLAQALFSGRTDVPTAARLIVDAQTALHRIPPPRSSGDPAVRLLHLDLHPENIMLGAHGAVLIDWRNAEAGPPELDVAVSALILAEVAVDLSGSLVPPVIGSTKARVTEIADALLTAYLAGSPTGPGGHLAEAARRRRINPNLSTAEKGRLDEAVALVREREHAVHR
ncbi:phosphotransferase [Plantactinospora sp. GCM10030261]|uniref:phosphotransferase n=1 Tax=Plantactinospora sp. GCM10030261 TaxID=3273420 RepID=UPI0036061D51